MYEKSRGEIIHQAVDERENQRRTHDLKAIGRRMFNLIIGKRAEEKPTVDVESQDFIRQFEGKTDGYIERSLVQMNENELGETGMSMLKERAKMAGMSLAEYVWKRRSHYQAEAIRAKSVVEESLLERGEYDSAGDAANGDLVSSFNSQELIEQAEEEIYKQFRPHVLQELAGADSGRLLLFETDPNRASNGVAAGIRHLGRKLNMGEEELRQFESSLLQEALSPTDEQIEKEIIPYVESIVDKVPQDNIREICERYLVEKANGDTDSYVKVVFDQLSKPLGLEDYGYSLDIVKEALTDGPYKNDYGRCDHANRKVRLFVGNIRNEHSEIDNEDLLQICTDIMAHELYHAYEHRNSEENDDAVAHRQLLGFMNHEDSEDDGTYARRTVELSAVHFSSRIYERFRNELASARLAGDIVR